MTRSKPSSLRRIRLGAPIVGALLLAVTGCQQKMARQPSFKPDDACDFFPDGKSARPLVAGTVARGHLKTDLALFTGRVPPADSIASADTAAPPTQSGDKPTDKRPEKTSEKSAETSDESNRPLLAAEAAQFEGVVEEFPFEITAEVMQHGRNRYMIYCVVCHDAVGTGLGKIVERGYTRPPSYHIERLRNAPVGHFFRVMTRGYGSMPSYAGQVPVRDRWAIAAFIRALQLSQRFPEDKLPDDLRQERADRDKLANADAAASGGTAP